MAMDRWRLPLRILPVKKADKQRYPHTILPYYFVPHLFTLREYLKMQLFAICFSHTIEYFYMYEHIKH